MDAAPAPISPPLAPSSLRDELARGREILLANALMLGEIPAPSGQEENRIRFLADRFSKQNI